MSHKTLIDSTAYDIIGGKALVSGTSYSIKNGKVMIDGTAYDISFFLPLKVLDLWSGTTAYGSIYANCIIYANGYWVVGGRYWDGSTYYARIAYATKLDGTWTIKDIWSSSTDATINCITYANGYWVVGGGYRNSTSYYGRIAYATSLDGTWTIKGIWVNNAYSRAITGIAYGNGYWVVCGTYATSSGAAARMAYATSLDGTWTDSVPSGFSYINSVIYDNGYFVICGKSVTTNYDYGLIAYTKNPRSWTNVTVWTARYSCDVQCVTYRNGYWIIGGQFYDGTSYYGRIAYATSLDGTWTNKNIWSGNHSSSADTIINDIAYDNGYWVAVGQNYDGSTVSARIAYATSLDGTWTNKDIWSGNRTSATCVTNGDGYWAVVGRAINTNYCARLAYAVKPEEIGDTN